MDKSVYFNYQCITDLEPDSSYVIVPDVTPYRQKDGITITGLEWFLKDIGNPNFTLL